MVYCLLFYSYIDQRMGGLLHCVTVMYHYTQCGIHFATHCCILLYFIIMTSFDQTKVS